MRSCRNRRKKYSGFAYLWTLLLVALLALGLARASEVYSSSQKREQEEALLFIGHQYRQAIGSYYEQQIVSGKHEYPASLQDLIEDKRTAAVRRHLRKLYPDPITGSNEWGLVRIGGKVAGVFSLSDRTPVKIDSFDLGDAAFKGKQHLNEWRFTYPANLLIPQDSAIKAIGADSTPTFDSTTKTEDQTK